MIIFEDLVEAIDRSGATLEAIDNDGATIVVPDMVEFAMNLVDTNSEWREEAHYFIDSREVVDASDRYRFTYTVDFPAETDTFDGALDAAAAYIAELNA